MAQSLAIFLVSASSARGFLSHLKSLLLPGNLSRTWKAISFLEGFSPLHCSQAVVMQQHFSEQSNVHILILLKSSFPMVLNLTTTFKASIALQFLLCGLLYIGWMLDKDREILALWIVFEQNTTYNLFYVLKVQGFILLLAEMWKQFIPYQQPWHLSLPLKAVSFALAVVRFCTSVPGDIAAFLCDPWAGGMWHSILPTLEFQNSFVSFWCLKFCISCQLYLSYRLFLCWATSCFCHNN